MTKGAYYNEFNPEVAEWLRNLISAGLVAPGDVDTRPITEVSPDDLRGYTQHHFFAGIGIWSYALRAEGWSDDRPIWTGSCPCQPFSGAGKGKGFEDERHLWPVWFNLIRECRPSIVLGEQVAGQRVAPWLDLVQSDMESCGSAFASVEFPACSVGAPNIRQRTYWMGHTYSERLARQWQSGNVAVQEGREGTERRGSASGGVGSLADRDLHGRDSSPVNRCEHHECNIEPCGELRSLADSNGGFKRPHAEPGSSVEHAPDGRNEGTAEVAGLRGNCGMADAEGNGSCGSVDRSGPEQFVTESRRVREPSGLACDYTTTDNPFWRDAEFVACRDGKFRPVESGVEPLAYGLPKRMADCSPELARLARLARHDGASLKRARAARNLALHGLGNALNAEQARVFVRTVMEII